MYVDPDYPTKKALKTAVANGVKLRPYQPAGIGDTPQNGQVVVEGPHYPRPHRWYAQCMVRDGIIVSVK